jgi:threonine dehydrogenase-like Zn-dependent dehydrogenase
MVLDVSVPRVILTKLLARVSRSAHFWPTSPLQLVDEPDPPLPVPNWVRVRNQLCGICGSDLHQLFLDADLNVAPVALPSNKCIYLGHEMVGVIVERGEDSGGLALGDRVVRWGRADDCKARGRSDLCPSCARGHRVLCRYASEPRQHEPVGGGYGEGYITPASTLIAVPDELSDEQAIFVEPAAVAIHVAWRRQPKPGDQMLVLGCGTIGFLLIQVLRIVQPSCRITALVQFPWQAEMARDYGADHVFLVSDDGYARVVRLTDARLYENPAGNRMLLGGFDLVFDVVGMSRTLNDALRRTRAGGTVVLVGVDLHRVCLDLTPVWHQEVDLIGSVGHDVVTWQGETVPVFALAMRWMQSGLLDCSGMLTHRFPLDEYRQAFEIATNKQRHRSIKVAFQC